MSAARSLAPGGAALAADLAAFAFVTAEAECDALFSQNLGSRAAMESVRSLREHIATSLICCNPARGAEDHDSARMHSVATSALKLAACLVDLASDRSDRAKPVDGAYPHGRELGSTLDTDADRFGAALYRAGFLAWVERRAGGRVACDPANPLPLNDVHTGIRARAVGGQNRVFAVRAELLGGGAMSADDASEPDDSP